jgi:glycosyl transferase family 87
VTPLNRGRATADDRRMRALHRRPEALPSAMALGFAALILFAGSRDVWWKNDFFHEVLPSYTALMAGDPGAFFAHMPAYSGFVTVVGGPASLLTGALGGHETMVFRLTALPGLLALAAVGVSVARSVRTQWWPVFLLAGAGGAIAYSAIDYGHPEDLLATGCAVGAVLAARQGRVNWATALVVVGIGAKQWAVLALLPAAMAAPRQGLRIAVGGAIAGGLVVLVPMLLAPAAHSSVTSTGLLFHPHQVWWPFGVPATPDFIAAGHGTRMGPPWLQPLTHPMIVGAGVVLALVWYRRSGSHRNPDDALGVLALAFLLRCMLDPWDLVYYHLPLVVSLAAWEARRGRELPVLAVVANASAWLTFVVYDAHTGNGPYFAYLAWSVPLAVWLAVRLLRRPAAAPRVAREPRLAAGAAA